MAGSHVSRWGWILGVEPVSPVTSMRRCATTRHKGSRPAAAPTVVNKRKVAGTTATNVMMVIGMTMTTEGQIGTGSPFPEGSTSRLCGEPAKAGSPLIHYCIVSSS
ncbi:MAG: hypothetical protein NTY00_03105 [Deltaproteobacteria bacterium]|nr:hypothetical protein [Deltaproteobacteria bacterium]